MTASDGLLAIFSVAVLSLFALQVVRRGRTSHRQWLLSIFVCGSVLRFIYCCLTPYTERGWDWWGHVQYVEYVVERWRVPPAQGGWQFYQPPLYYFIAAALVKLTTALGRPEAAALIDLRLAACAMSIGAFAVGMWIAEMLFRGEQKPYSIWFSGILAVFPGFVHFASRVSNDVPLLLFSYLLLAFLIRWWQHDRPRDIYFSCLFLCLGLLTKLSVLPLAAVLFGCVLANPKLTLFAKGRVALACLVMIVAFTGWLFYLRYAMEQERSIVGNAHTLAPRLRVDNSLQHLTTFNPVAIVQHPYNNNFRDLERRDYFWEYAFRSAHFGEFHHGNHVLPLARALLLLALAGVPLVFVGFMDTLRRDFWTQLPICSTFVLLVLALFCYRLTTPYAPNQDFRFIPLVLVPASYFLLRAISLLPARWQQLSLAVLGVYLGSCAGFTIWILL